MKNVLHAYVYNWKWFGLSVMFLC